MTVMRRGRWKRGRWGEVHKSIKSVCMDSAVLLYHHSPCPASFHFPDELNYLLSLLTPDDCSFPLAHIIYTIRVMFPQMSAKSLVSQSSISYGVHRTTSLFCCQVRTLITFLSRLEEMQFLVLYPPCANSRRCLILCLRQLLHLLAFTHLHDALSDCLDPDVLGDIKVSKFQFRP